MQYTRMFIIYRNLKSENTLHKFIQLFSTINVFLKYVFNNCYKFQNEQSIW